MSKTRNILGRIAGGIAGLSGDPKVAANVNRSIRYGPYEEEEAKFKQGLGIKKNLADIEMKGIETKGKEELRTAQVGHLGAQSKAEEERAKAEKSRAATQEQQKKVLPPDWETKAKHELDVADAKRMPMNSMTPVTVINKETGEKSTAYKNPRTGLVASDQTPLDTDKFILSEKETKEQLWRDSFKTQFGRDPTSEEFQRGMQGLSASNSPERIANLDARTNLARAETQLKKDRTDPELVKGLATQMSTSPDSFFDIKDKDQAAAVSKQWTAQTGLPAPTKVTADTQKAERMANNALYHANRIRNTLSDPKMQQFIGPMLGRLGKAEETAGDTLPGVPPEYQQAAQNLRSSLRYLLFQEGANLVGGRVSQYLIKGLEGTSPDVHQILPMLKGSLDAIDSSAKINLMDADHQRFGSKVRKERDVVPYKGQMIPRYKTLNGQEYVWDDKQNQYFPGGK
jgi:hypothetical protein